MMTPEQAAERLGVARHQVADVVEHGDGHVVTLTDDSDWLVTPQVARLYVPDVDGDVDEERAGEVDAGPADEPGELEAEERTTEPAPEPKAARSRRSKS